MRINPLVRLASRIVAAFAIGYVVGRLWWRILDCLWPLPDEDDEPPVSRETGPRPFHGPALGTPLPRLGLDPRPPGRGPDLIEAWDTVRELEAQRGALRAELDARRAGLGIEPSDPRADLAGEYSHRPYRPGDIIGPVFCMKDGELWPCRARGGPDRTAVTERVRHAVDSGPAGGPGHEPDAAGGHQELVRHG